MVYMAMQQWSQRVVLHAFMQGIKYMRIVNTLAALATLASYYAHELLWDKYKWLRPCVRMYVYYI